MITNALKTTYQVPNRSQEQTQRFTDLITKAAQWAQDHQWVDDCFPDDRLGDIIIISWLLEKPLWWEERFTRAQKAAAHYYKDWDSYRKTIAVFVSTPRVKAAWSKLHPDLDPEEYFSTPGCRPHPDEIKQNPIPKDRPSRNFPPGHRFFSDCQRETYARWIEWALWAGKPKPHVWFATFTFKDYVHERRAYGILLKWLRNLRRAYEDRPATCKVAGLKRGGQLRWIVASEWQVRNVIHYHLLISGVGLSELSRKRQEVRWETGNLNSGFCRIYDADPKAAPYLAKYIQKGNELQKGGYWRGLSSPNSVRCCQPNSDVDPQSKRPLDPSVESDLGSQAAA